MAIAWRRQPETQWPEIKAESPENRVKRQESGGDVPTSYGIWGDYIVAQWSLGWNPVHFALHEHSIVCLNFLEHLHRITGCRCICKFIDCLLHVFHIFPWTVLMCRFLWTNGEDFPKLEWSATELILILQSDQSWSILLFFEYFIR